MLLLLDDSELPFELAVSELLVFVQEANKNNPLINVTMERIEPFIVECLSTLQR